MSVGFGADGEFLLLLRLGKVLGGCFPNLTAIYILVLFHFVAVLSFAVALHAVATSSSLLKDDDGTFLKCKAIKQSSNERQQ